MLTIIIVVVLSILFGKYRQLKKGASQDNYIFLNNFIVRYSIAGIFAGYVIAFMLSMFILLTREPEMYNKYLPIENLQDNNQIRGRFVLGSGVIDGVWKYTVYCRMSDGSLRLKEFDASSVDIRYVDTKPAIEYKFKRIMRTDNEKPFLLPIYEDAVIAKVTILVNKGTIKQNYSLDAQ